MFHVHSVRGRIFSGGLAELRQHGAVTGIARTRRVAPVGADGSTPVAAVAGGAGHASLHPLGQAATQAYGQPGPARARQALRCAADVMHSPAVTVPAGAALREAGELLTRHGIGQAPVVDERGTLVGLVGRAALTPAAAQTPDQAAAELARLQQPVSAVMWSPVPSTAPDTDLRRVAAVLLDTGLPGMPVADAGAGLVGFVSRTDLLRALATDPPLDLWG